MRGSLCDAERVVRCIYERAELQYNHKMQIMAVARELYAGYWREGRTEREFHARARTIPKGESQCWSLKRCISYTRFFFLVLSSCVYVHEISVYLIHRAHIRGFGETRKHYLRMHASTSKKKKKR